MIRDPHVAGMFYPSNPKELKKQIHKYIDNVSIDLKINNVAGIIAPHAGYMYSGQTAAFGYKTIQGKKYDNVIVISPSHREYFSGFSIYSGDAYKTPLGEIQINNNLANELCEKSDAIFRGDQGHKAEHALEVQLPFLQSVLNNFKLIPIVIGDQNKNLIFEFATVLESIIDENTLIVCSSDLSHYYSKHHAAQLDDRVVEHINAFKYDQLQNDLDGRRCEACGGGGIVALLKAFKAKDEYSSKVLAHTDSGAITGDDSEVVGYLSAIIYN